PMRLDGNLGNLDDDDQIAAIRSQRPLPHFSSNLAGTVASTGLRKLSRSGSITFIPAFLKVSTRLASCDRISLSCQAVWVARAPQASTIARKVSTSGMRSLNPFMSSTVLTGFEPVVTWRLP